MLDRNREPELSDGCREFRLVQRATRRQMLTVGALSGMGLILPDLLRARAAVGETSRSGTFGRAKSVIFLYLHGGHPQQETWDPKPNSPSEVRGDFDDVSTAVPGTRICELFPRCASITDQLTILRSLTHDNSNHVQASLSAMTGHHHPPGTEAQGDIPPSPDDFPPYGAVLSSLREASGASGGLSEGAPLPTWVQVGPLMRRANGTVLHGQQPGFLGARFSPFVVNQDMLPADVSVNAVTPKLPVLRLRARRRLLAQVDEQRKLLEDAATAQSLDYFYQRAFGLLTSQQTARAFDLAAEPASARERYGMTQFGQCCLLARRLAEARVPMINVHYCHTPRGSWDTHRNNAGRMKGFLAPTLDQSLSALVTDLGQRGLLDETLVVATAEFGRTPKINEYGGRDHWPWVYSIALAGAGMKPGVVYGSSDKIAAYPETNPRDPRDFAATLYHLLGVPPETSVVDREGQRHQLITGDRIREVLA